MGERQSLKNYLERYSETDTNGLHVAAAIDAIACACVQISELAADGALLDVTGSAQGTNADGDVQKYLDVRADEIIRQALAAVQIAALVSEEVAEPVLGNPSARICVAVDPLDGSSNIEIDMAVGTIFSILLAADDVRESFTRQGTAQIAAGFVVYGPQTALVLTVGKGVDVFVLDRIDREFRLIRRGVRIPAGAAEFAINASNRRHWDSAVGAFIDQCLAGADGALGRDFNMRWIGSLVAETYRILMRGGVFLYPGDARAGYAAGRLRLVYEAHPMAFIIEQAGGAASTGHARILDLAAETIHQRVPLIMGGSDDVDSIERLYASTELSDRTSSPLFAHRGFFRT